MGDFKVADIDVFIMEQNKKGGYNVTKCKLNKIPRKFLKSSVMQIVSHEDDDYIEIYID